MGGSGELSVSPFGVASLAARGDRPALLLRGGRIVSYRELAERIDRLASRWRGDRGLVTIEADLSEHAVVAYLAALEAGHAVALCGTASMLRDREVFRPEYCYRRFDGRWRMERLEGDAIAPHPELAVLLSTSGSTGHGKWVRLSHMNIQSNARSIAEYLGLTAADRGCLILPLHYSYGLSVLNAHLAVGASVYMPGCSILDEGFLDELAQSASSNFAGVPYSYDLLEKAGFRARDFPALRFMTVAGGRLAPELVRRYNEHLSARNARLFVMYGQTEATARMAYMPPDRLRGREDRIGIAIPGGSLTIEDNDGRIISSADQPGELVYRGPNVMMGYASSRADLARGAELSELRTGDLAVRDADGVFRIVGRTKRISKIAGLRIGHDALEAALEQHGVAAAVVGNDTEIHAYYVGSGDPDEVRRLLVEASGLTLMHVGASRLDKLPRLTSGKIDYPALRMRPAAATCGSSEEGDVEALFAQLFYPKKVRPEDSFLSLGGDSLRFVQLSIGLEKRLGELPEGWEKMPVGALAAHNGRERKSRRIGADFLIRALAILLVVVHHETLWPIPGGSAAMVILAGFGLARFQSGALLSGAIDKLLRPLAQILVPYYLIVASYALAWGDVPWASVFLVGNFGIADPGLHGMVPYLYWFIEAYCQMLLVFGALFAVPFVRRAAAKRPLAVGMALFAAAFAARMAFPLLIDIGNRQIFTLPWIFYMAVLGWCAAIAETWKERSMVMLAGTGVFLFLGLYEGVWIGTKVKYLLQIAVLAALLFLPRIRMPQWGRRLILPLSAAGFHIYILHRFVPELLLLPIRPLLSPFAFALCSILGGIALGIAAWLGQRRLIAWLAGTRDRRISLAPVGRLEPGLASVGPLLALGPQEGNQVQRQ
ncbi:AMP-dependent synthetase [Sinorhizobium meliloti]|uniref:AMP-binding protein n=1 Tax=Rhizobium meliloti TaxID=382 RepID=UPI0002A54DC9|nr:AMP-binding protein [Sinorhizobium meliloti]AGA06132.1 Acyl-CoA synthetases (AMP-forming)/AMP-acid ligases II [Sinorhizobium meliloti GR4]MQW58537.1 AMP-binding protein [Sinorhizobium meliloti]MQX42202.1 AMP-binding protein [Sinorhizobium meliloti]MQX69997.1 AMP-binding protein [Sinorhizobium meliloti]MQX89809.1 AMP-binding protein [Sinorhizobium meliloti]